VRRNRSAFVLTDVFDLPHEQAAVLCEVSEEVYRQRISRARRALEAFTRSYCGLVAATAPCHCSRRVARAEAMGRLHRAAPVLATHPEARVTAAVADMEDLHDAARLMRQHPPYLAPMHIRERLRAMIRPGRDQQSA
jgi:hypothetical protein